MNRFKKKACRRRCNHKLMKAQILKSIKTLALWPFFLISIGCGTVTPKTKSEFYSHIEYQMKSKSDDFNHCFQKYFKNFPNQSSAHVKARWTIETSGRVNNANIFESTLNSKTTEDCITSTIQTIRFSPPAEPYGVIFPMTGHQKAKE
jgi:hypothetical protein